MKEEEEEEDRRGSMIRLLKHNIQKAIPLQYCLPEVKHEKEKLWEQIIITEA